MPRLTSLDFRVIKNYILIVVLLIVGGHCEYRFRVGLREQQKAAKTYATFDGSPCMPMSHYLANLASFPLISKQASKADLPQERACIPTALDFTARNSLPRGMQKQSPEP